MTRTSRHSDDIEAILGDLLQAARSESPSAASQESSRLAALGVLSALPAALPSAALPGASASGLPVATGAASHGLAGAALSSSGLQVSAVLPMLALGFAVGIGGAAVVLGSQAWLAPVSRPAPVVSVAPGSPLLVPPAASPRLAPEPSALPALSGSAAASAAGLRAPASAPPSSSEASARAVDDLKQEIALIQAARVELEAGQSEAALRTLQAHQERVAQPRLEQEAQYLRLRALVARGSLPEARALARQLLAGFPDGPHAAAAQRVLEGQQP